MDSITTKAPLTEDTVIGSRKITAAELRKFFNKTLGDDFEKNPIVRNVIKVSLNYRGKTLKEIIEECNNPVGSKRLEEVLAEERFKFISAPDKSFILSFDRAMNEGGYDFGGKVIANKDLMVIAYGKTGTKTRPRPACFHIEYNGNISLKLYLHKIDDHRQYIEGAPAHIRDIFTNDMGNCNGCNFKEGKCKYKCTKIYTFGGRLYHKCYFNLTDLAEENIPDYMHLLSEFFPMKKVTL